MIYSKTCEYALRALAYLASKERGSYVMTSEIFQEAGVPEPYLAKIFQGLAKEGLLQSRRGPAGGFALVKSPDRISLYEVVQAVDDTAFFSDCIMGLNECSADKACPLHTVWSRAKSEMLNKLKSTTVLQLARQMSKRHYRGSQRAKLSVSFKRFSMGRVAAKNGGLPGRKTIGTQRRRITR